MEYKFAKKYETKEFTSKFMGPNPIKLCEELLKDCKITSGSTVMDLGSGQGATSVFIAKEYGYKVYAADLWSEPDDNQKFFDEECVPRDRLKPVKADAEDLPFDKDFFNGVICVDAYNFFGRDGGFLDKKLLPFVKSGAYVYLAISGIKQDYAGKYPPEIYLSWTNEQMEYIKDIEYWKGIFEQSEGADIVELSEMEGNEELWRDWIKCDNTYSKTPAELLNTTNGVSKTRTYLTDYNGSNCAIGDFSEQDYAYPYGTLEQGGLGTGYPIPKTLAKYSIGIHADMGYCEDLTTFKADSSCTNEIANIETWGNIAALGHTLTHVSAVAAICTAVGNTEYWHCTVCDKYFSDEECTTEITLASTVVAKAAHTLTHVSAVAATCTAAGNTEYWHCTVCDKYYSDEAGTVKITLASTVLARLTYSVSVNGDTATITPAEGSNVATGIDITSAILGNPSKTIVLDLGNNQNVSFNATAAGQLTGNSTLVLVVGNNADYEGAKLVLNITLNGAGITFNGEGKATVTYAFPDTVPDGKVAKVYYVNGTERTDMNATFANGKVTFDTTHFSTYIIVFEDAAVTPTDTGTGDGEKDGLSGSAIAGIVIGCLAAVAAIAVGVFFFLKKKKVPVTPDSSDK